jgi:hypothetical protein
MALSVRGSSFDDTVSPSLAAHKCEQHFSDLFVARLVVTPRFVSGRPNSSLPAYSYFVRISAKSLRIPIPILVSRLSLRHDVCQLQAVNHNDTTCHDFPSRLPCRTIRQDITRSAANSQQRQAYPSPNMWGAKIGSRIVSASPASLSEAGCNISCFGLLP